MKLTFTTTALVALLSSPALSLSFGISRTTTKTPSFLVNNHVSKSLSLLGMSDNADDVVDIEAVTVPPPTKKEENKETFEFEAEVGRVMDIIINSLYSDKDIFLRELISNAADACDKKRFLSIGDEVAAASASPEIKIKADEKNNLIIIEDTGIGMTRDEVVSNLGRIAQSGTKNFVEALGESGAGDTNLIGQFGVGFYSAYLVANKVEVITKSMQPNSKTVKWESDSGSSYVVSDIPDDDEDAIDTPSGTRLILHLKDDASRYLQTSKIEDLLNRYSEFIEFPLSLFKESTTYEEVPDVEANAELKEGDEPKTKTVPKTTSDFERMNNQKPIWLRPPKDVTEPEYQEFYKSTFRSSYDMPQKWSHFVLEGQVECKALLYVPGMLPFELSKDMFDEDSSNIRLYVKRVFINDKFEDIVPRWLKFVKGIVDSDDLPLNVSREILQKSKVLSIINKRLVRKSIDMFNDIAKDEDSTKYITFWNNFGKYIKVGVIEDDKNREKITPLLRFFTANEQEEYTSLDDYIANMKDGQKDIYYVTGQSKKTAMLQPAIEKLSSKGYDVLLMTEPLDEIMIEAVKSFKDVNIVDAAKDGLDLDGDDDDETKKADRKKKQETLDEQYKSVREYLEVELGSKVQKVKVSELLTGSPAALVQGAYGMSPTMQKYMKAQSVAMGGDGEDDGGMGAMGGMGGGMNQAVLEINPTHPIVKELQRKIESNEKDSSSTRDYAMLMYDVASMTGGYEVSDMGDFAKRVIGMMGGDVAVDDAVVTATEETPTDEATKTEVDIEDDAPAVEPEVL